MARARDRAAVWLSLLLWLGPVTYTGLVGKPLLSRPLLCRDLMSVSCLFAASMRTWPVYWVQMRQAGGHWELLDDRAFFGLEPFGHRTRLDRLLFASGVREDGGRAAIAAWLFERFPEQFPDRPLPDEIRFVATWLPVRADPPPEGAWVRPPLQDIPPNHLRVLSTHVRRQP